MSWQYESFPIASGAGLPNPMVPTLDAINPLVGQSPSPFQYNVQGHQAFDDVQSFQAAATPPPGIYSLQVKKFKDDTGKVQAPGQKDLPFNLSVGFRDTFIRHIIKLVLSGRSPWSNPLLPIYQQEFSVVYPGSPYHLQANDAVIHPVSISCHQAHHHIDILHPADQP
jgi:hypothetical protein